MKNKTTAALLALFLGAGGIHKFYLGQIGWGVVYLIFPFISFFLGIINAIQLFNMSEEEFNYKYNRPEFAGARQGRRGERYDRYQERERQRADRTEESRNRRAAESAGRRAAATPRQQPVVDRRPAPTAGRQLDNPYRAKGVEYFKEFDFPRAISAFEQALQAEPRDLATHFNIACAYSQEEDADKAFYHIDRAVALGFNDFTKIREHDSLAFLRIQERYPAFEEAGFRLSAPPVDEETTAAPPDPLTESTPDQQIDVSPPPQGDLLDQLQHLGRLREQGLLSEIEFSTQKQKLLNR
ncbi:MAG: NINE protein [Saprospiraceae bacterium]